MKRTAPVLLLALLAALAGLALWARWWVASAEAPALQAERPVASPPTPSHATEAPADAQRPAVAALPLPRPAEPAPQAAEALAPGAAPAPGVAGPPSPEVQQIIDTLRVHGTRRRHAEFPRSPRQQLEPLLTR